MDFFATEGDECWEKTCDNPATTLGHCRFHYIKHWKEIKEKEKALGDGRLIALIQDLVDKYPAKYLETVLADLQDDKSFYIALKELNIDTDFGDFEDMDGDDDEFGSSEISSFKSERPLDDED